VINYLVYPRLVSPTYALCFLSVMSGLDRQVFGPVPNGTLRVHLRSYRLKMAASCVCSLRPRDRRVSHSSFKRSEGCLRARPLCALDPYFCRARTGASSQQTSTRQSKQHYDTKVRTQRKTASASGAIWDKAFVYPRVPCSMCSNRASYYYCYTLLSMY